MTLPLFSDYNYTLSRDSLEVYREFEDTVDGRLIADWEMLVPETAADGVPYQFIFVGPTDEYRGTAIRLHLINADGSQLSDDADVLLETYYRNGSERTELFQGKYGHFREIPDQHANGAALAMQRRGEAGEDYIIRLLVSVPEGASRPDLASQDSYFELECVKLWWNESA